jgi:hypothetical protein
MLYKDDAPAVEVGVVVGRSFSPDGHSDTSELGTEVYYLLT